MDCDCYPSLLSKVLPLSVERTEPPPNTQWPAPFASLTSTSTASPDGSAAPATLNVSRHCPSRAC